MTYRDQCIIRAALQLFAEQTQLPAHIADIATNGGQFALQPADAERAAISFENATFAGRLLGDLTKPDAEQLVALIETMQPSQRRARAAKGRQERFARRALAYIGK